MPRLSLIAALLCGSSIAFAQNAADKPAAPDAPAAAPAPADKPAGAKPNARHRRGDRAFNKADKDHDGLLDKDEAKALPRIAKHFDEIDTDHDGKLTRDEIHAYMKARREAHKNKKSGDAPAAAEAPKPEAK